MGELIMLKISEKPFTAKYPILYTIKIKDGAYTRYLSTIIKNRAENVCQWLNNNKLTDWQKMTLSEKRKLIYAGVV